MPLFRIEQQVFDFGQFNTPQNKSKHCISNIYEHGLTFAPFLIRPDALSYCLKHHHNKECYVQELPKNRLAKSVKE